MHKPMFFDIESGGLSTRTYQHEQLQPCAITATKTVLAIYINGLQDSP